MLIRARILVPVTAPPVEDGAVFISGDRIEAVGPFAELRAQYAGPELDLGEVVVLPGLVNAHCHLDYTHLAGRLVPPRCFPDWIKAILAAKAQWDVAEFSASWRAGAQALLETGTTTVANIESMPQLLPECRAATPLRVYSFLEMTGIRSGRDPDSILEETLHTARSVKTGVGGVGLSPHAPYSTTVELLRKTAEVARREGWRTTTHVAESIAEFDMFMYRRGPMFEWLEPQRSMEDCGLGSPVQHLERCGLLGPNHVAVHANYLWHGDAERLAASGTHVVHCPSSHAYFGHRRFPFDELPPEKVNVALGTDSLASTRSSRSHPATLSLLEELRQLLATNSTISPFRALRFATVNGAKALGLAGRAGELSAGSWADLIAIPYAGSVEAAPDGIVHYYGKVAAALIAGAWALAPRDPAA